MAKQSGKFDQIYAMINEQPQEAIQALMKQGAKPEQIMQLITQGVQKGKIKPEIAQAVQQAFQKQAQVVKHGAKLQYIKSLKHQCADDEELVYYKKGGKAGCGCRKKIEEGGEIPEAKCGAVAKFKKARKASMGTEIQRAVKKGNTNPPKEIYFQREKQTVISLKNQPLPKPETKDEKEYNKGNIDQTNMNPNTWRREKSKMKKDSAIERFKNRKK